MWVWVCCITKRVQMQWMIKSFNLFCPTSLQWSLHHRLGYAHMERHTGVSGWRWVRFFSMRITKGWHLCKFSENQTMRNWMRELKRWITRHKLKVLSFLPQTLTSAGDWCESKIDVFLSVQKYHSKWVCLRSLCCNSSGLTAMLPQLISRRHTSCLVNFSSFFPFWFLYKKYQLFTLNSQILKRLISLLQWLQHNLSWGDQNI